MASPIRQLLRHAELRAGIRDMAPVVSGIGAWGLMTGVAIAKSGMSGLEMLLMGTLVFAGSSQLAAIPLIVSGAPMWVVLATAFCVNLRFVVFSAHLRPYVMHQRFWRRMLSAYSMADLAYVLFVRRFPEPATAQDRIDAQDAYWLGCTWTGWAGWTGATVIGIGLANAIPVSWGLGFAGMLALLGIACSLATTRLRVVSAGIAGAAAVAAYALPLKLNILVAIAAAVAVCLMMEQAAAQRAARDGGRA